MVRPAAPTVRVMQRFEHAARRHPFLDGFGELLRRQRWFSPSGSRRNRLTIGTQHGLIGADRVLHLQYFALQPLAQITYLHTPERSSGNPAKGNAAPLAQRHHQSRGSIPPR